MAKKTLKERLRPVKCKCGSDPYEFTVREMVIFPDTFEDKDLDLPVDVCAQLLKIYAGIVGHELDVEDFDDRVKFAFFNELLAENTPTFLIMPLMKSLTPKLIELAHEKMNVAKQTALELIQGGRA